MVIEAMRVNNITQRLYTGPEGRGWRIERALRNHSI